MLNRKGLSPLILEIIGGVIVVSIIILMFGGFASPFLEFMSDSKGIEAFNKFTATMSRSCREGSETVPYFSLIHRSTSEVYVIGLIQSGVMTSIQNIDKCSSSDDTNCSTGQSKEVISSCVHAVDSYCWCLFKIKFPGCGNSQFNSIAVNNSNIANLAVWDTRFSNEITNGDISRIGVLMCSNVQDEIKCNTTNAAGKTTPVFPLAGSVNGGYLVWMQSNVYMDTTFLIGGLRSRDLFLDSMSFDRPISNNKFSNTSIFTSNPPLRIKYVAANDINSIQLKGSTC